MADRNRRGGYQPPARPAPVSTPGSGRRTDGGPGNARQPLRVPTGGRYGEAQALERQQQGAPLPDRTVQPRGGAVPPSAPTGGGAPAGGTGIFGPTERPYESPTAGAQSDMAVVADNVDHLVRIMYAQFPHPAIAQLMRKEPERRQ